MKRLKQSKLRMNKSLFIDQTETWNINQITIRKSVYPTDIDNK